MYTRYNTCFRDCRVIILQTVVNIFYQCKIMAFRKTFTHTYTPYIDHTYYTPPSPNKTPLAFMSFFPFLDFAYERKHGISFFWFWLILLNTMISSFISFLHVLSLLSSLWPIHCPWCACATLSLSIRMSMGKHPGQFCSLTIWLCSNTQGCVSNSVLCSPRLLSPQEQCGWITRQFWS